MRSVGVDIGSSSVKVVEVQMTAKGLVVSRYFEKILSPVHGSDPEIEIVDFLRASGTRSVCTPRDSKEG